jgi:hypothetical protein
MKPSRLPYSAVGFGLLFGSVLAQDDKKSGLRATNSRLQFYQFSLDIGNCSTQNAMNELVVGLVHGTASMYPPQTDVH